MKRFGLIGFSLLAFGLAACGGAQNPDHDDNHGHPHDGEAAHAHDTGADGHGHSHGDDGDHSHGDDHGHAAHDDGHDDHGDDHGHGGGVVATHFTDETELFVEYPPLAVGRGSPFAAHFTRLDAFAPVDQGTVTVRLTGGGLPDEAFRAEPSAAAGVFRPVATPRHAGLRRLTVELSGRKVNAFHDLGTVEVYASVDAANASLPAEEHEATRIPFLKEQQWKVDFATAPVETRRLSASVPAPGVLEPAPGGDARITASTDGVAVAPSGGRFPDIGDAVEAGDILARLLPQLGGDEASARAAYNAARADLARAEGLFKDGAVSQRRVDEARAAAAEARARLDAASQSAATAQGSNAGIALRAPVSGRIAMRNVVDGQFVGAGDSLFRIVDASRLRLTAHVAEIDAAALGQPRGAWFKPAGSDAVVDIAGHNGRLIGAGGAVDPVSRTVPVVFEFDNPEGALRAGTSVSARVRTDETFEGATVPASALIDDAGQDVVFVMADGENWERRVVRIALRDGAYVGVASGVAPGERIVSRGAYFVHLAASGPAEAGHGHAH